MILDYVRLALGCWFLFVVTFFQYRIRAKEHHRDQGKGWKHFFTITFLLDFAIGWSTIAVVILRFLTYFFQIFSSNFNFLFSFKFVVQKTDSKFVERLSNGSSHEWFTAAMRNYINFQTISLNHEYVTILEGFLLLLLCSRGVLFSIFCTFFPNSVKFWHFLFV